MANNGIQSGFGGILTCTIGIICGRNEGKFKAYFSHTYSHALLCIINAISIFSGYRLDVCACDMGDVCDMSIDAVEIKSHHNGTHMCGQNI